jgi:hypothetical protein
MAAETLFRRAPIPTPSTPNSANTAWPARTMAACRRRSMDLHEVT